eukprot:324404_1
MAASIVSESDIQSQLNQLWTLPESDRKKGTKLLLKILSNLRNNLAESEKYGNLRNTTISAKLSRCKPAFVLLLWTGFNHSNDGERLIWSHDVGAIASLDGVYRALQTRCAIDLSAMAMESNQSIQIPISVKIPKFIVGGCKLVPHSFSISVDYSRASVKDVIDQSINYINHQLMPTKYHFDYSNTEDDKIKACFDRFLLTTSQAIRDEVESFSTIEDYSRLMDKYYDNIFGSVRLSDVYDKKELLDKGFQLKGDILPYTQTINAQQITCPYLLSSNNKTNELITDATIKQQVTKPNVTDVKEHTMKCPTYQAMSKEHLWNEENLKHLTDYTHFEDHSHKIECQYKQDCKWYKKMVAGEYGLDARCHCKLFRHPPRANRICLNKDIHPFTYINIHEEEQKKNLLTIYCPVFECMVLGLSDEKASKYILNKLIQEVVDNGYEKDLCLDKDIDYKNKDHTLMSIVSEKMNHPHHKRIGCPLYEYHILALLLYTGCTCNHDLCLSQRNGDYEKWKVLDWCLNSAIRRTSPFERGTFKVWSAVCGVQFDQKEISLGYLPTFTSTSYNRQVAEGFAGGEGALLELDEELRSQWPCCDVSWISDFPEYEILFSRLPPNTYNGECYYGLQYRVVDNNNGIQIVSVKLKKIQNETYQTAVKEVWDKIC